MGGNRLEDIHGRSKLKINLRKREAWGRMIDSISTAIEVAQRPGKVFLALVEINQPTGFYQIITVPSSRIRARLNKYLPNARAARLIDESFEIHGRVHLLGYQDKSEFNNTKTILRKVIGPEGQAFLASKIDSLLPQNSISIAFTHSVEDGIVEVSSGIQNISSIQDLVKKLSTLNSSDWWT